MAEIAKYINEVIFLLGKHKRKLPFLFFLFFASAFLELIGLGLIGPFLALLVSPDLYDGYLTPIFVTFFSESLTNNEMQNILGVLLILVFFFKSIFSILILRAITLFSNNQAARIRHALLKKFLSLPYEQLILKNSSYYIYSIQELANKYSIFVLRPMLQMISEGTLALGIFLFLASNHFLEFAIIFCLLTSAIGLFYLVFRKRQKKYGEEVNELSANIIASVKESFAGVKYIKILGLEEFFSEKLRKASFKFADSNSRANVISASPRYLLEFLIVLVLVIFVNASIWLDTDTTNIIPAIGVIGLAAIRLLPTLSKISHTLMKLRFHRDTVRKLCKDLSEFKEEKFEHQKSTNQLDEKFEELKLEEILFKYPGAKKSALNKVNLSVKKGEIVGIVGESGAGKTTLVDVMLGLLKPNSGQIYINGNSGDEAHKKYKRNLMYIPQDLFLIDDTLKSNIILGSDTDNLSEEKIYSSIKRASISNLLETLSDGLETKIGEDGSRLSGGQKQRVIIARAFYLNKEILFLDEPTSSLDNQTESEILEVLRSLKGERTLIIISHRTNIQLYCDRVYKIHEGKVEAV